MKNVYGYIRVSTVKQGTGVSLQEQKEAIIRYAEKHQLNIIQWFEEQETAAKQGRPLFNQMMKSVKAGKSNGVIIHKIDRSARNLKDWALLGDLIDQGFEIHFAHESLDMDTRGGRLAADIQAVIASDYIRNLREEASKGLYDRLKQGIYPFGAPTGYIDNGGGKVKTIDPIQGPLVRKAFELYATEKYSLFELVPIMQKLGLRNTKGNFVNKTTLSKIFNNPFYTGILKVKGKTFQGGHQTLVSSALFLCVQSILQGKTNAKVVKHNFLFRRLIKCEGCNYSLVGEKVKGHIYYRCHTRVCQTKALKEETIDKFLQKMFEDIQLFPSENEVLNELLHQAQINWTESQNGIEESLKMQQGKISLKLDRLTDAYIEGVIDKNQFEEKKERVMIEMKGVNNNSNQLSNQKEIIFRKVKKFLELVKSLKNSYLIGITEEKQKIIKIITSNFTVQGKELMITIKNPFLDIANRWYSSSGGHDRNSLRICTVENANTANYTPIPVDNQELRARMKELLEMILSHFALVDTKDVVIEEEIK